MSGYTNTDYSHSLIGQYTPAHCARPTGSTEPIIKVYGHPF